MKLRAIGTGSAFCRHPLVTSSFLIQSEKSNTLIGCGPNIPAKLETINLHTEQMDMVVLLNAQNDHIGGLEEMASLRRKEPLKPFLAAPQGVLEALPKHLMSLFKSAFQIRAVHKVTINEEHFTETVALVKTYLGEEISYGALFEEARIFLSGAADLNDEHLHRHGMPMDLILHQGKTPRSYGIGACVEDLQTLPIYLQQKMWLYGYANDYLTQEDPLPMLFLPQGTCVFDSERKEKHLDKERFIRENSKRVLGNLGK